MADQDTALDLEELHDSIVADIQDQFPGFATVEFYEEDRTNIALPACLLEMTELEHMPEDDPGTGQIALNARFEANVLIGFKTAKAKLEVRKLCASMAGWLHNRRWSDVAAGPVVVIGAYKDEFQPHLDKYEVWRIEWAQVIHMGTSVWNNEADIPTELLVSFVPRVGIPYVDEYVKLVEAEE